MNHDPDLILSVSSDTFQHIMSGLTIQSIRARANKLEGWEEFVQEIKEIVEDLDYQATVQGYYDGN